MSGKASGVKTAPPGHHKTQKDRQLEAIARAEAQKVHTGCEGQHETRLCLMRAAVK